MSKQKSINFTEKFLKTLLGKKVIPQGTHIGVKDSQDPTIHFQWKVRNKRVVKVSHIEDSRYIVYMKQLYPHDVFFEVFLWKSSTGKSTQLVEMSVSESLDKALNDYRIANELADQI